MERDLFAIIDVGKTNAKLVIADLKDGRVIWAAEHRNRIVPGPPYKQLDVPSIESWLTETMAKAPEKARIATIVPVAHGCGAVPLDAADRPLPACDYEEEMVESIKADYEHEQDPFALTLTPNLPLGLNLGRQIYYVEAKQPDLFRRFASILPLPQYWAWVLSGVKSSEVTSLGAHSGLWRPKEGRFSDLAQRRGWSALFPPVRKAGDVLGPLRPELVARTGFPADVKVLCGIHDSNCSYLNHMLARPVDADFAVVSTGTWVIILASGVDPNRLDPARDMLGNVDAFGKPVATARYMGGREYGLLAGEDAPKPDAAALARVVTKRAMALPNFTTGGGPFMGRPGEVIGGETLSTVEKAAMASAYIALMTDVMLDLLGTKGEIIIEGSFSTNPLFASILATLRPGQRISVSDDRAGTVGGARLLALGVKSSEARTTPASAIKGLDLAAYRHTWRSKIGNNPS
jgi:sugar (pentulose or hexulose) kinase